MATSKTKQQAPITLDVDTEWLRGYEEKMRAIGKEAIITEYAPEPVTDQADLSDVVSTQEEEAARLKNFVDSPLPKTKEQIKRDKELNAALQRGKAQARKEQALHRRAQKMDAASEEREAKERRDEQERQRAQAESKEEQEKAKTVRDVRHVTQGVNKALENVNPLLERVGTLPTLGGVGLMIGILLILLVVVIPVNAQGDTRAKQFWYMLNGRAKLQGAVTPIEGSQVAGASGDFGTGTSGTPNTIIPNTTAAQNGTFRVTPLNLGF